MSLSSLRTGLSLIILMLAWSLSGSQAGAVLISDAYVNFQANNCIIPAGKSMCPSTLYVTTYAGRTFSVTNLNRGLTTQNLLTPNNYTTIPGSTSPIYTVSTHITGDAANYISYGESNNLNLFEGTKLIARAITTARCTSGTLWNGQICSTPGTASPIACTMEARMCPDGTVMPRNMNTCEWFPNQCNTLYPTDPLPPTISTFSISCTKPTYLLGEAISCKIKGGTGVKTCWQAGKSSVEEKNCVDYRWVPDGNGIDLSYNSTVTSWVLGTYTLYARDASGKIASTQVRYSDGRTEDSIRMDVKSCTIDSGKSRCAATVDVTAPAGKYFNLENAQRGVTSTNIIRPGVYTITTSFLGDDAANYITYGVNDLILKEGTLPVARASTNAICALNTKWNGQICSTPVPQINPGLAVSKVTIRTGNGDTVFTDNLYTNISKNSYIPSQVTKNINIPPTTSILNVTLSSTKSQCSISPNYKTDTGISFSNNAKVVNKADFPNFSMSVPTYSVASQIGGVLYGRISTVMISCDTPTESVKDFLIYNISLSSVVTPSTINFQANNCTIPVGKSTCASTLYVIAPSGKMYSVRNFTRNITTSNLLNPNNYSTIPGSSSPAYSVATHPTGDAANYASYGVNDLGIYEGTSTALILAKAVMTATCATGTIWNGQVCAIEPTTPPPDTSYNVSIEAKNCTIAVGKSLCASSISVTSTRYIGTTGGRMFGLTNITRNLTTSNLFTPNNATLTPGSYPIYNVSTNTSGDAANYATHGANDLSLIEGDTVVAKTNMSATCASGSTWNGQFCKENSVVSSGSVLGLYKGYLGESTSPFITTNNISRSDALNNCKLNQSNNPTKSIRCTWNEVEIYASGPIGSPGPIACTMEARLCANGSTMPRNQNTCEWLPEQCTPVMYATHIGLSQYTINNTVYDFSGNEIIVKEGETLSLKGYGRPGALAYFWREGQMMTDSVGLSSTSGEWILTNVWSPAGAKIVIPGTYTYILSGLPPSTVPGTTMQSAQTVVRIKVTPATTDSYIDFQANNCTIAVGKSTCASTLYLTNPQGKLYSVKNITRGLTTSNLLTPNNYTNVPGSNYPTYSVSTHPAGDAANYATNGMNELSLFDSTSSSATAIKKAVMTASCVSGSTWNGQICTSGVTTPPTNTPKPMLFIERNPKILGPSQNMTLSWTTTNATSLSYFCSGTGPQANKKVDIALNRTPYSEAWDKLISDGWSGKYECNFIAVGPGGSTVVADAFTITPRSTTPNPTPYTDFQANNCTIQANKSTCVSSIFVRAAAGKYFHVTNSTRGLTTSNLLNPTNYVSVIGSTTPMYMATTHSTGDAANYITHGVNDLMLKEGATIISKAVATGECIKGTSWNGKMCVAGGGIACTDVVKYCEDGSIMPRDPNCGWLPGQCGGKTAQPLSIACSKSSYTLGEAISCKISGGVGTKSCWQLGTKSTEPKICTDIGWNDDNNTLYYYSSVSTSMLGEYALYVKDSQGNLASTKVNYISPGTIPPVSNAISFEAYSCYIPAGQNKCASTLYVKASAGKTFSVSNLSRGITTSNLLTPNNYSTIPGSNTFAYTVSTHPSGDAANYITYGESNTLTLIEGRTVVARAIASAKCIAGTTWNGKACVSNGGTGPIYCTMEVRMCEDGSVMPRDTKSCAWLPGQCPIDLNPIDPIIPTKPYGIPTIKVLNIGGASLNGDNFVAISKSPTESLRVKGEITSIRSGYTIKLTSNKSDYYTTMPVSPNGAWGTDLTPTPNIYQSRIVVEGDNLLTFSLMDDATKTTVAQSFVKVRVTFTRGGIILDPPICVMAAGSTGTCLPPPTTPTYPNCPRTTTSTNSISSSSLIYCPPEDTIEINPTNTINPKPPITKPPTTSTGVRVPLEQPTIPPCNTNGGNSLTIGCTNNSVDVMIIEGLPTTPIEEALDLASRKRIDTIIARTRSRVADMSTPAALAFIDSSIKRIQALPNKTAKAKLIDAYTLSRLQSLRNTIKASSTNNTTDDYIGLVDNVLSN